MDQFSLDLAGLSEPAQCRLFKEYLNLNNAQIARVVDCHPVHVSRCLSDSEPKGSRTFPKIKAFLLSELEKKGSLLSK